MTDREELARLLDRIDWHNMSPLDMAEMIMRAGYRRCGQGCPEAERARADGLERAARWHEEAAGRCRENAANPALSRERRSINWRLDSNHRTYAAEIRSLKP